MYAGVLCDRNVLWCTLDMSSGVLSHNESIRVYGICIKILCRTVWLYFRVLYCNTCFHIVLHYDECTLSLATVLDVLWCSILQWVQCTIVDVLVMKCRDLGEWSIVLYDTLQCTTVGFVELNVPWCTVLTCFLMSRNIRSFQNLNISRIFFSSSILPVYCQYTASVLPVYCQCIQWKPKCCRCRVTFSSPAGCLVGLCGRGRGSGPTPHLPLPAHLRTAHLRPAHLPLPAHLRSSPKIRRPGSLRQGARVSHRE